MLQKVVPVEGHPASKIERETNPTHSSAFLDVMCVTAKTPGYQNEKHSKQKTLSNKQYTNKSTQKSDFFCLQAARVCPGPLALQSLQSAETTEKPF